MSGSITMSGLASGIPFDELVAKMVEAETFQARKLEAWKQTWVSKVDTLRDLSHRVNALQTANDALRVASSFITRMATSTNSNVADIAVDSTALIGNYELRVAEQVRHRTGSTGVADGATIGGVDGILEIRVGDELREIDVSANMTLAELQAAINTQSGGLVNANIMNDGSTFNANRLVLTSSVSGRAGTITFGQDDTGLMFGQRSQDSQFEGADANVINDAITQTGNYTGHVSKRINFTVQISGGETRIRWEDPTEGRSGTVAVPQGGGTVTLPQGLEFTVNDMAALRNGQQFSLDVFAPDIQMGQDRGLAQSAQIAHNGLSSNRAIVTTVGGVFQYSYRGIDSPVINVPENTTLEGLVRLINEQPGNPGVRASIINDGMGTATSFHLVLTGVDSGAANQIEIRQATLTAIQDDQFQTIRQATNALIKVDGFPIGDDNWIQKSSNLITDIIGGASIRLRDVGTTNFTITNDDEDMADKVQAFVDEYNALMDFIDEITRVVLDAEGQSDINAAGILTGNYAVNMLRSALRRFIGIRAVGFDADRDVFSLLTQVGIRSNDQRRIDFDRDEFRNALNSNPEALIKLFSADGEGALDNNNFIFRSGTSETRAGIHRFSVEYNDLGQISRVSYTDSTGQTFSSDNPSEIRISSDNPNVFTVMAGSARGAAIEAVAGMNPNTTQTFNLTVKDGKGKTFHEELNRLFDENTGLTKVIERNYELIIRNIDRRIDRENMRVLQVKRRLEMRFARLEVNMSIWNGQMERLQQQLRSLPQGI